MDIGTFILLADPQLGGSGGVGDIKNLSNLNDSLNNISSQIYPSAMGLSCSGAVGNPKGVFIAGDLTQDGGDKYKNEQADIFGKNPANYLGGNSLSNVRKLYDPWHPEKGVSQLTKCGNIYFGLGNHDLPDSAAGSGWRFFNNRYSGIADFYRYQMWDFIAQMHTGFKRENRGPRYSIPIENFDAAKDGCYEWKSGEYSFNYMIDLGPVDVYQLHRYGGDADHGRETGIDWLKRKLAERGYKRPVIIVQHFPFSDWLEIHPTDASSELWNKEKRDHLMEVLLPYHVLAVCVGHNHNIGSLPWEISWPNARNTLPASYVKPKINEIRPGAAFHTRFALFRVEGTPWRSTGQTNTGTTTLNIVYGEPAKVASIWTKGFSQVYPAPPSLYVRDLEIVFVNTQNENTVLLPTLCTELSGQSADINKGFGGKYVYIRPLLTTDPQEAITGIETWSTKEKYTYPNIAEGTKGDNRYIIASRLPGTKDPITGLFLLRSKKAESIEAYPSMAGMSEDINKGRGGGFLYLIWRTWTDNPPPLLNVVV